MSERAQYWKVPAEGHHLSVSGDGQWVRRVDYDSLLREVEELEKKCEELRFGVGVHWPDSIQARLALMTSDRDSLKAKLEVLAKRAANCLEIGVSIDTASVVTELGGTVPEHEGPTAQEMIKADLNKARTDRDRLRDAFAITKNMVDAQLLPDLVRERESDGLRTVNTMLKHLAAWIAKVLAQPAREEDQDA